ncbi:hypothetical protein L1987_07744 [Smallanthus sonchifolius]|uniref:Uncharacterized protein n=1 Tax=Smallanthus sonchifolius TaxID=185202 RepID=A0ACB9K145_9ASTR|nr:hypothetical protein L1987_07744 [Smallanthus sonchifolius]
MPRKKDPPPSALPPRRSTRGVSKSASLTDGEDSEALVVPLVGLRDSQKGLTRSLQPPSVVLNMDVCDINKEVSAIPSVSVSLDDSEQVLGLSRKDGSSNNSPAAAGCLLAGNTGFTGTAAIAGLSDSDSSESPGVQYLHTGSLEQPPVTPLFSPEFKAMLGREYPKTSTVFGPSCIAEWGGKVGYWTDVGKDGVDVSNAKVGEGVHGTHVEVLGNLDRVHVQPPEVNDELHEVLVEYLHGSAGLENERDKVESDGEYLNDPGKENRPEILNQATDEELGHVNYRINSQGFEEPDTSMHGKGRPWEAREEAMQEGSNDHGNVEVSMDNIVVPMSTCGELIVDTGGVLLNTEYAGDSILDSLSRFDSHCLDRSKDEEEDQEVNSDQSNGNKKLPRGVSDMEIVSIPCSLQDQHPSGKLETPDSTVCTWSEFVLNGMSIRWPETWSNNERLDLENLEWDEVLRYIRTEWESVDHSNWDHEVWRKATTAQGTKAVWLDVERNACQEEEAAQRNKKKKFKRSGGRGFTVQGNNTSIQDRDGSGVSKGKGDRTKHKIWTSRNRKPEKNLSTKKIHFRQEFTPREITSQNIGYTEFRMGHDKDGEKGDTGKTISLKPRNIRNIYNELEAREARLKDIVNNINRNDENSMLVNSIMSITRQKVTKFSAKMNANGIVSIDEDMVENEQGTEEGLLETNKNSAVSYANMADKHSHSQNRKPDDTHRNIVKGNGPSTSKRNDRNQMGENNSTGKNGNLEGNQRQGTQGKAPNASNNQGVGEICDMEVEGKSKGKERNRNSKPPDMSVIETANRFLLLDDEENEIGETTEVHRRGFEIEDMSKRLNSGWVKKQERILNSRYAKSLSQEQRFEAKRYVQDRLVPLEVVLSSWPVPLLEYFRHLCSLHNFGDGSLAATINKEFEGDESDIDLHENVEQMEEVDSETDGNAVFMKQDKPSQQESSGNQIVDNCSQEHMQPSPVLDMAGVNTEVC